MIRKSVLGAIAAMLLLAGGGAPAAAQTCADVYAMMMKAYEAGSPRYLDIREQYDTRCAPAQQACEELRAACFEMGSLPTVSPDLWRLTKARPAACWRGGWRRHTGKSKTCLAAGRDHDHDHSLGAGQPRQVLGQRDQSGSRNHDDTDGEHQHDDDRTERQHGQFQRVAINVHGGRLIRLHINRGPPCGSGRAAGLPLD